MTEPNNIETTNDQPQANRRQFLTRAGLLGAAVAAGTGMLGVGQQSADAFFRRRFSGNNARQFVVTDADILNFALNLEYLEAEYYLHAVTGFGLNENDASGVTNDSGRTVVPGGEVTGGRAVSFATPLIEQYAEEIALDEFRHVGFLRRALGAAAVARPAIDIGQAFTAAARAANVIGPNDTFDPYANENNFLLGAFIFEDVGVTAYGGAVPFIKNTSVLTASAGILAVEAYHAGEIRTVLVNRGQDTPFLIEAANKIAALRNAATGIPATTDEGITDADGDANIVPADPNSIAFVRAFEEVLSIVYLGSANTPGGFFPEGMNGRIA
ncbi:MAG TPA: ferritin-like domain-containing protein [Tepidisphaeraceae bacterium]|nr:ferritin-like domain-containing protein [Tepidisphaeraceae bacterium]